MFCAKIRSGLNHADFDGKRQVIELLDVRCKIDFENDEKMIWLKCLIEPEGQQQLLPMPTSPLSSTGNRQQMYILTARLVVSNPRAGLETRIAQSSLADVLFLEAGEKAEKYWLE
jgi:hypothetical protein